MTPPVHAGRGRGPGVNVLGWLLEGWRSASTSGDIAVRSDGETLAVFHAQDELRARLHGRGERFGAPETITDDALEPAAGFVDGRPRVEWRGGASERG